MFQNLLKEFLKTLHLSCLTSGLDQKLLTKPSGTILKYIVKFGWAIIGLSIDGPQCEIILQLR